MFVLINCCNGICGNMFLGAFINAGMPIEYLKNTISRLPLRGWDLLVSEKKEGGIRTTFVDVRVPHEHHHRHLSSITRILEDSDIPDAARKNSIKAFTMLAVAEAAAHGTSVDQVHFHEVGAMDAIIDIVGSFIGFDYFGIESVYATPVNLGGGTASCAHGKLPVPVPAVQHLLRGLPVFSDTADLELTTPTGAAILTALNPSFNGLPEGRIVSFGYGSGSYRKPGGNILSMTIVEDAAPAAIPERITELESNIDDRNPELLESLMEKLFTAGAYDVFLTPVIAKKSRPSTKISILCPPQNREKLINVLLQNSGTFGVRYVDKNRTKLFSSSHTVQTPWGDVPFRIGRLNGKVVAVKPEYETCRQLAEKLDVPLVQMYDRIAAQGDCLYELHDTGRESTLPEDQEQP